MRNFKACASGKCPPVRNPGKARRMLPAMRSTIAFFWATVAARLVAWQLSATVTRWLREELLPGLYLEQAAEKASTPAERQRWRTRAAEILARARSPGGVGGTLSETERADLGQSSEIVHR